MTHHMLHMLFVFVYCLADSCIYSIACYVCPYISHGCPPALFLRLVVLVQQPSISQFNSAPVNNSIQGSLLPNLRRLNYSTAPLIFVSNTIRALMGSIWSLSLCADATVTPILRVLTADIIDLEENAGYFQPRLFGSDLLMMCYYQLVVGN